MNDTYWKQRFASAWQQRSRGWCCFETFSTMLHVEYWIPCLPDGLSTVDTNWFQTKIHVSTIVQNVTQIIHDCISVMSKICFNDNAAYHSFTHQFSWDPSFVCIAWSNRWQCLHYTSLHFERRRTLRLAKRCFPYVLWTLVLSVFPRSSDERPCFSSFSIVFWAPFVVGVIK